MVDVFDAWERGALQPKHPIDGSAHGARIGDTIEGRELVLRVWRHTAWGSPRRGVRYSMQRIGGFLRALGNATSPYRIALCDWAAVERQAHSLEMGEIVMPVRARLPKAPDRRQAPLPFMAIVRGGKS